MLQVRHVDLWLRLARRTVLPHIADDSDDRHRFQGVVSGDDHTAQGIASPNAARTSAWLTITTAGPACHVAVGEVTPFLDRHPEHLECSGRNHVHCGRAGRAQCRFLRHPIDPVAAVGLHASRRSHHGPGRDDAWKLLDIREQRPEECATVSPVGLNWSCRCFHHDDVRRLESEWYVLERNQTLDEQSGGCDKCDRERDFGDHEHFPGAAAVAPREPASSLPKRRR